MPSAESSLGYRPLRRWRMYHALGIASAVWCFGWAGVIFAEGNFVARVGPSGEFLELRHPNDGQIIKDYLPLHQSGAIRYFSTGVGFEARQAEYPRFSLKLVFTAGGKPYLTGVEVAIRNVKDHTAVRIPKEQIDGPWLFVDLPSGIYDITATNGAQKRSATGVKIIAGKQKTLYLRWTEDAGASLNLSTE